MIGLDTNVVVRLLTADDPKQLKQAQALVQRIEDAGDRALISVIVLCETAWVLDRAYGISRQQIADAIESMLSVWSFEIEDRDAVSDAMHRYRTGTGDFADLVIGVRAKAAGCSVVATFDKALHKIDDLFSSLQMAL